MNIFQRVWGSFGFAEEFDDADYDYEYGDEEYAQNPTMVQEAAMIPRERERKSVILNMLHMDPEQAQRSVDFVAGGVFAIDGHQERLGENIFLFTPNVVQITAQGSAQPTFNPTMPVEPTQPSMLHTMSAIAPTIATFDSQFRMQ